MNHGRNSSRLLPVVLLLLLTCSLVGCGGSDVPQEPLFDTTDPTALRDLADQHGIGIGAAVISDLLNEEHYADTLAKHFNMIVAEYEMKWNPIQLTPGVFDFSGGDKLVDFAQANGMQVRGHALVWHQVTPDWVTQGSWTDDELMDILKNHVTEVAQHYQGKIVAWDVVNEAISDQPPYGLRGDSPFSKLGQDYIDQAFIAAHMADPEALLFYNDYGVEGMNGKANSMYNMVKGMLERGVPLHGVGLQMHITTDGYPLNNRFEENVKRFTDLDLEVHITEADVRIRIPSSQRSRNLQAQVYHDLMAACLRNEKVTAFLTWGFTDNHSWVPDFFNGYGDALLFDDNYLEKQAYFGLQAALKGE
jgi:endo-1,4-beta-xylanase